VKYLIDVISFRKLSTWTVPCACCAWHFEALVSVQISMFRSKTASLTLATFRPATLENRRLRLAD